MGRRMRLMRGESDGIAKVIAHTEEESGYKRTEIHWKVDGTAATAAPVSMNCYLSLCK